MGCGYVIIFIGKDGVRYPSAHVHETWEDAVRAYRRKDQENPAVAITTLAWDETRPLPD